jgi:hypothetical protein
MTSDYVERTGSGGPGSAIITNDDAYLLDIADPVTDKEDYGYAAVKSERSY